MPSALQPSDAPRAVKTGSPCAGAAGRRPCRRSYGSHAGRCPRARARRRPRWPSLRPRVGRRERSRFCVDGARRWRASARRCTRSTTEALRCRAQRPPTASRHNAVRGWKPESRSRSLPSARHVRMIRRRHGACQARRTAEVTEDRPSRGGCPDSGTPPVPRRHRDTPPGGRRAPRGRSATRRAQHPRSPAPAAGGACGR